MRSALLAATFATAILLQPASPEGAVNDRLAGQSHFLTMHSTHESQEGRRGGRSLLQLFGEQSCLCSESSSLPGCTE